MFRKYEKTFRILVPQIDIKGKHYLSKKECQQLLNGKVTITEKMDGANVGIVRYRDTFHLQKRGSLVGDSEHAQFNFFKAWSYQNYDKIMQIPKGTVLYGELMYAKHTIFYDRLPDYFLAFAWLNKGSNRYYKWDEMKTLCDNIGFHTVPLLHQGYVDRMELFDMIPDVSNYGSTMAEGIVVWNHKKGMRGKVVRSEFQKFMDNEGHWMNRPVTPNEIIK